MHGDGIAGDSLWGNFYTPLDEQFFTISVETEDVTTGTSRTLPKVAWFTTIGPIVLDHYEITSSDTIPNPGNVLRFKFILHNNGITSTAKSITSHLICLDTLSSLTISKELVYSDIDADTTSISKGYQYIRFNGNCPDSVFAKFRLDISSDDYAFWSDTFSVFITHEPEAISGNNQNVPKEFVLFQNYPNPFNPKTVISSQLPVVSKVDLSIYDILGQKIATLVSKKQPTESYKVEWDASGFASGLFFYRLGTDKGFVQLKKLILMK